MSIDDQNDSELSNPSEIYPEISVKDTENDSDTDIQIVDYVKVEHPVKEDFFTCNCKEDDKLVSTHYCEECNEGLCKFCIKAHQRFDKLTKSHNVQPINYYCKCNNTEEEKIPATKYCQECSEAFCMDCVIAHGRLIMTKNHILKSI